MRSSAPIRIAAVAILLTVPLLAQPPRSQQTKPTAAIASPSTLPATPQTVEPPPVPLTPAQLPPRHAQISYTSGVLSVSADNSSLNQILRQISSLTGIKITGGVADERVFGQYGPADPPQILADLLTGTSSNMVIEQRGENTPAELILTPRQGGPTPPNPNAAAFDDHSEPAERPEQPVQAQPQPAAAVPTPPVSAPAALSPGEIPTANPSQPDSPNGVKTPQQIYEQLQRMRQQQQTPPQ